MSLAENIESFPQQTGGNYQITRFNALQHGVLSHYTVLPWEDGEAYRSLIDALATEHNPNGPTEEHLVEELAGISGASGACGLAKPPSTIARYDAQPILLATPQRPRSFIARARARHRQPRRSERPTRKRRRILPTSKSTRR